MDIEKNPRPNHRITRCCGNCRFFLNNVSHNKEGRCILPEGPKLSNNPNKDFKNQLEKFDKTHAYCTCDNHQWKHISWLRRSLEYAGVKLSDIK